MVLRGPDLARDTEFAVVRGPRNFGPELVRVPPRDDSEVLGRRAAVLGGRVLNVRGRRDASLSARRGVMVRVVGCTAELAVGREGSGKRTGR